MILEQISLLVAGGALVLGGFLTFELLGRGHELLSPQTVLAALISVAAVNAGHWALMHVIGVPVEASGQFFEPLEFLFPPLLAAYGQAAMTGRLTLRWSTALHFLPFLLAVAVSVMFTYEWAAPVSVSVVLWGVLTIQILAYLVPALRAFHRYQDGLADRVSNLEKVDLSWLRQFFWIATALSLVWLAVLALLLHGTPPPTLGLAVSTALLAALWVLGTRGLKHHPSPAIGAPLPHEPASRPPLGASEATSLKHELLELLKTRRPYLDPELSLGDLAQLLGVPRNTLSFIINSELGVTFYDLINQRRIAEFCRLAADPSRADDKILTLAFDAGFNSKPTFNKVVLKETGVTPSVLRRQTIESHRTL